MHDIGQDLGFPHFSLEFVSGGNLAQRLAERTRQRERCGFASWKSWPVPSHSLTNTEWFIEISNRPIFC